MSRQDANAAFALSSFLQGTNATYIDEIYARYEKDPASVDPGNLQDEVTPLCLHTNSGLFGKTVYVSSAGVRKGELDPFAVAAMEEIGIDIAGHKPVTFEDVEDLEGLNFDLIVTLSPSQNP